MNSVPVEVISNTCFRTQYNSQYIEDVFEVNNEPSLTQPGDALSVEKIIQQYVNGYGLPHDDRYGNVPDGIDLDELADFDAMDEMEQRMYLLERKQMLDEMFRRHTNPVDTESESSRTSADSEAGGDKPQTSDGQNKSQQSANTSSPTVE